MNQEIYTEEDASERSIPRAWRQMFRDVVSAFIAGDYQLKEGIAGVGPIPAETASQIQDYIRDYGATLVELPEDTWESSFCAWTGSYWNALIDLWTQEEGRSDLVLKAQTPVYPSSFIWSMCRNEVVPNVR